VAASRFHTATVLRRTLLTPGMLRLTFGGAGLDTFRSTGIGDEYLRLFFPDPATGELALPVIDETGRWTYPDGPSKVRCSTYTVRRFDPVRGELDIDFVVHAGGVASDWAQRAAPGDSITLNSPRGLYAPPPGTQWQLLAADATGLPALSRLLEQMPPGLQTRVFAEVIDAAHEQPLATPPGTSITWLHGGNGVAPSGLDAVLRRVPLPAGPGYVWVAGEQKVVRGIRKYVRQELKLPAQCYELVGYWVAQHDWEARYEALDPAIRSRIEAAWESDRDPEEVQDEVDATYELVGL